MMSTENSKATGYARKEYGVGVKRYCQTLDLKNDPELIAKYIEAHDQYHSWPEIRAGIREVGILEMEIYILGTHLFMIVEVPVDFDWDEAMEKLASLPRQKEWENTVEVFQACRPGLTSSQKWQMMERIFYLYE